MMWDLELESGDSVTVFEGYSDAIGYGVMPMLGDFSDDYDLDEIYDKLYAGFNDDDGHYWVVERWALEHPEWTKDDARDYVIDILMSCDKSGGDE